jgi:hypothetical protein
VRERVSDQQLRFQRREEGLGQRIEAPMSSDSTKGAYIT